MSVYRLPSGKWRAQVHDPRVGRNVGVGTILGGRSTFNTKREAKGAREDARERLAAGPARGGVTLRAWFDRWSTEPLFERPKRSTMILNVGRVRAFVDAYGDLPLDALDDDVAADWLAGGPGRVSAVPSIRVMLNDARSAKAGRVMRAANPFAGLGIGRGKGNAQKDPPDEATVWELIAAARRLSGPYFAAWLQVAAFTGCRPGELDALRWNRVDLAGGRIDVVEQFNSTTRTFTPPKNGRRREAILTPHAREALLALPRDPSGFVFVNTRGDHFTPSHRAYHWRSIRAAVGYADSLYLATRHFAGWYMTNVLELPSEDVAIALGHTDGGELVRTLYGHRDRRRALDRVAQAYETAGGEVRRLRAIDGEAGA